MKPIPPGHLLAYTDGSTYKHNPGPISWAVVYVRDNKVVQLNERDRIEVGAHREGTNNRAELMAVIWALEHELTERLIIMTDSMITMKCATGLYQRHANRDLWHRFDEAMKQRKKRGLATEFRHVRGHHTDEFNKMADRLAAQHAHHNFNLVIDDSDLEE